jgi:hypothetical protein
MTEPADHADSLALTVCRLGLDPASGRLRHRGQLGVAIRGALRYIERSAAVPSPHGSDGFRTPTQTSRPRLPIALVIGGAGLFGGKPRPRRQLSSVDLLLRPLLHEGVPQPETVRAAVRACLRAMR